MCVVYLSLNALNPLVQDIKLVLTKSEDQWFSSGLSIIVDLVHLAEIPQPGLNDRLQCLQELGRLVH
jgi:hypothetical protein